MDGELRRRALERAVEIAGGAKALRQRFNFADHQLEFWLRGRARVPDNVFDAAVDLILEDDIARAVQDRREGPREELKPIDSRV
jgi:hypothetical protein